MRSHIHELWEDLELSPQYPEPGLDRVMDRVMDQIEAEEPEHPASQTKRRRPMHKKKLLLSLAAALVVLTGSAVAVANHYGVLDLFFTGDTSQLESYVQTAVDSAENSDYRLTLDSSLYDGQNIYAVITVTGLNDQAIEDLKSNKVIAETHRETWGQEMVDSLMESGSTGPDTFCYDFTKSLPSLSSSELPAPSGVSRSWKLNFSFSSFLGIQDEPFELWLDFLGHDLALEIPLNEMSEAIHGEPMQEVTVNALTGTRGVLYEFTLGMTSLSVVLETYESDWDGPSLGGADESFFLRMKDGNILTSSQLGAEYKSGHWLDDVTPTQEGSRVHTCNRTFAQVVDLSQVKSFIFGDIEFPVDGSQPFPAEVDEHLYPFTVQMDVEERYYHWYLPLEAICQGLGADYTWDEETQTATATYRGVTIEATVGSTDVLVNGEAISQNLVNSDGEEVIRYVRWKNGTLYVPFEAVSDNWSIKLDSLRQDGQVLETLLIIP